MLIYTASQIAEVELNAVKAGISTGRLMENAGSVVSKIIRDTFNVADKRIAVVCGKGNNGGDGFVVARKLMQSGANVTVVLASGISTTKDATTMFEYVSGLGISVLNAENELDKVKTVISDADIIVDAIFGIGFRGELNQTIRQVCEYINKSGAFTVAIDIPSGVHCDSATVAEGSVNADITVTFFGKKLCHVVYPAVMYCGEVKIGDIGTPTNVLLPSQTCTLKESFFRDIMPKRAPDGHKGTFGRVGFVCGSYGMAGAAKIAITAAIKSGIGIAVAAVSESVYPILASQMIEPVFKVYHENAEKFIDNACYTMLNRDISDCNCVLVGCGLGNNSHAASLTESVIENADCPVIIDADGINCISRNIDILRSVKTASVITPHYKEMARLCGITVEELMRDRIHYGKDIATRYDTIVVLKGASTLVFAPDGKTFVFTGGNSGMATAGSGDMLAGIISAFASQCNTVLEAALLGVYIHGKCGELAVKKHSKRAMTVTDMLGCLEEVYLKFEQ